MKCQICYEDFESLHTFIVINSNWELICLECFISYAFQFYEWKNKDLKDYLNWIKW